MHLLCDVHLLALVFDKTLIALDDEVSGAIRVAKALRTGLAKTKFRQCLREEIASRLEILQGTPPLDAVAYKKKVLRLFISRGAGAPMRRALLSLCPNGDWRAPKSTILHQGWVTA